MFDHSDPFMLYFPFKINNPCISIHNIYNRNCNYIGFYIVLSKKVNFDISIRNTVGESKLKM